MKKLIITNFKTFNGSKELVFSKGYTVLSGPNGSGKSNTLDAILFVLGRHDERVKKTVAEVISKDFTTNKLLADFAEVSLVFEADSDIDKNKHEKIVVSRQLRIPASGNAYSIYKLNGTDASLGEILKNVPIMDYNVVKQGEITSRMYETPDSRRKLIEKVAGLAQLDPLITESTAKILNARETLKRIGFLLTEAKSRLADLEREKERTLNFRKLEGEMRKFKAIKIYSTKLELMTKLNEVEDKIDNKKSEISRIKKKILEIEIEIEKLGFKVEELNLKKRDFENKKTEISVHYSRDLKKIEEIEQRLDEIKILVQSLENRIEVMNQEVVKLDQDKQKILIQVKKSIEQQNKILNKIKDLQFENKNLELTLPMLKEKTNELDLKRNSLFTQINDKEMLVRQIDVRIRELRQKRINFEEKIQEYDEIRKDQTSNLGKTMRELRRLQGEVKLNLQKIEKYKQEIKVNYQLFEKQRLTSREFELKNVELQKELVYYQQLLQETRPNYSYAVQQVLEARNTGKLKGVIGTIIELIEEIKSEYAIAIEAAGGVKLQNIVTENFEITKEVIDYIKKIQVGKITFYPLDTLEDWKLKPTPNDQKVIGKIIDLIKFNREKYFRVMVNIFKNTLLVQDLDTAKKFRSYRAVTKEGDLIEPGGWITTRGKFEPRFLLIKEFYRKKIAEIEAEAEKVQQLSKNLESELNKLETQNQTKQTKLEHLVELNSVSKGRILELEKNTKDLEVDIKKWQVELEKLEVSVVETKAEEQNAHIRLSKVLEELDGLNREKQDVENEIAQTELGKTEKIIDKNHREILKFREDNRKFEKEREVFNSQLNQIESNLTIRTSRIEDLKNRITNELLLEKDNIITRRDSIIKELDSENAHIKTILENIADIEANKEEIEEKKEEKYSLINENEALINKIKQIIAEELQENKIRIELRIQELENQIKELGFEITEDFEINLGNVNQEIDRLELEISSLGLIDQQAPEKYEAENLRLTDLLNKKNVYEKELNEALDTKEDLLTQKRLKFLKTISDINTYLNEIFVQLYGKGQANLVLIDKRNPLESGIDIEVNVGSGIIDYIGTLSGGEKSMLALAFIFAIQRYQPAQIYFLDEIDSYLDDSHCEALGRLLKRLSENSQYIVITPRLNALSTQADRIYGVWLENGSTEIVCQQAENFAGMEGT